MTGLRGRIARLEGRKAPPCLTNSAAKLGEKLSRLEALVVASGDATDKIGASLMERTVRRYMKRGLSEQPDQVSVYRNQKLERPRSIADSWMSAVRTFLTVNALLPPIETAAHSGHLSVAQHPSHGAHCAVRCGLSQGPLWRHSVVTIRYTLTRLHTLDAQGCRVLGM
ncbi:MAG: hypothetical protein ACJAZ1_001574 [Yoonia sp.]|jgi:hypothetical protein